MGVLGNFDHERFCQIAHKRIWGGEQRATALAAAYREAVYSGENANDKALAPDSRRLANRKDVKARLAELSERAAQLAEIDAGWAMVELKKMFRFNLDDFLTPATAPGEPRFVDLSRASREQLEFLDEVLVEEEICGGDVPYTVRKTRIKRAERLQVLALMARIAGWEAPKKLASTDPSGEQHAPLAAVALVNILAEIDGSSRSICGPQDKAG